MVSTDFNECHQTPFRIRYDELPVNYPIRSDPFPSKVRCLYKSLKISLTVRVPLFSTLVNK